MRLAIVTTHPIQYYAPVFRLLHQRQSIEIKVFYTWGESALKKHDPGFNKTIEWDIPLLEGYPYEWVDNTSADPGSHHFKGVINPGITSQISQWQPGALLVFGWAYQGHLKVMRHFKNKVPVYFRGDSTLLDAPSGIKGFFRSPFLKWVYKHIDHAFYVGTNNKLYFQKFGLQQSQLSFAPHAVDNDRFAGDRSDEAAALRDSLKIESGDTVILFAGKFENKKAPDLLLKAFVELAPTGVHLLFVGNGYLRSSLQHAAGGYGNIHFLDFQNQSFMPVVYQACDIFCLPSRGPGETWGLAVNEAMACGKAVVVSDKVGCAIDLVDSSNGSVFRSDNVDELGLVLKGLVNSKQLLPVMGKQSAKRIVPFNFSAVAQAIEEKVLEGHRQKPLFSNR